jgi:hypothetical protein
MPYFDHQPGFWFPPVHRPVDLAEFEVCLWEEHGGDSDIWLAKTGNRTDYLIKTGSDAVSEMAYFALAEHFNLPSQLVRWCAQPLNNRPAVAIFFEADAVYPQRLDLKNGLAWHNEHSITVLNALDYYAHLALNTVCRQIDSFEFMSLDGILFRIDAAAGFDLNTFRVGRKHPLRPLTNMCARLIQLTRQEEHPAAVRAVEETLTTIACDKNLADLM